MTNKHNRHSSRRNVVSLIVVLLAFWIILPQLSYFKDSVTTLRNSDFAYIELGGLAWLSTFFTAAFVYKFISLRPLLYEQTLLVQLASGFTNRLAPLGAGIVTLNMGYLIKRGHTSAQAGAVVALNNILGFVGIIILLLCTMLMGTDSLRNSLEVNSPITRIWGIVTLLCVFAGIGVMVIFGAKLLQKVKKAVRTVVENIFRRPLHLGLALGAAILITVGYAATLYAIGLAFNVHLSAPQALFVLTVGVAAGAITPTPGGIGGAEIGLIAALVSVGVSSHQALTVALMYRFLTYWLPILPGFICLQIAIRRRYI